MTDKSPNVEYWYHQTQKYLDILSNRGHLDAAEHDVRGQHDAGQVVVTCPRIHDREAMAEVIRYFERGGFAVQSATDDANIIIDASAERLPVAYSEE